jgi:hypothetical protein
MTLLARSIWPVFLLAMFLLSCEEPGDIDLGIRPTDRLTVRTAEFPLSATQMRFDSINTTYSNTLMVGSYQDSEFGKITAKSYTQFGLAINTNPITSGSTYDSLVLNLGIRFTHGTNFSSPQEIRVHRVAETLFDSVAYYSFREARIEAQELGRISRRVQAGVDTVISIRLDDALGLDIFNKAISGSGELNTSDNFRKYLRGLALLPGDDNTSVIGVDVASSFTSLVLHHHSNTDTLMYRFVVGNTLHFSNIKHDRTGSAIQDINPQKTDVPSSNGFLYSQSGTGIFFKIDFDNLFKFADTLGNFKVNMAEIYIKAETTPSQRIRQQQRVSFYFMDQNNNFITDLSGFRGIQVDGADQRSTFSPLNIVFDPQTLTYRESITGYAQSLLDGKINNKSTIFFPFDLGGTLDRTKVSQDNIRIKVFYTVVN